MTDLQTRLADHFEWWNAALAGKLDDPDPPAEPQSGRYRVRTRNKATGAVSLVPVAYWLNDGGNLACRFGYVIVDEKRARELWPSASLAPITNELYRAACDNPAAKGGQWIWPDLVADETSAPRVEGAPSAAVGAGALEGSPHAGPAADQFEQWRAALRGEVRTVTTSDPPYSGFFENRRKDHKRGTFTREVVAIWRDDAGALLCKAGHSMLGSDALDNLWSWGRLIPITKELYDRIMLGEPWPDVSEAAERDRLNSAGAPEADSFDGLKDRIDDLAREAEQIIKAGAAKSQEAVDRAADLASRLGALETQAEAGRKGEKAPHMTAAKSVDDKWNPVRDKAGNRKSDLKTIVITPFLTAQRALAEAAEAAAHKIGVPAPTLPEQRPAGTIGRGVALREIKKTKIVDYQKTLAYFADNAQVRVLIQQLANGAYRNGTLPPGCEPDNESKAA